MLYWVKLFACDVKPKVKRKICKLMPFGTEESNKLIQQTFRQSISKATKNKIPYSESYFKSLQNQAEETKKFYPDVIDVNNTRVMNIFYAKGKHNLKA